MYINLTNLSSSMWHPQLGCLVVGVKIADPMTVGFFVAAL